MSYNQPYFFRQGGGGFQNQYGGGHGVYSERYQRGRYDHHARNATQNFGRQSNKHSGAKHTRYTPKTGTNAGVEQYLTTGWKLSRNKELIAVKAVTTSKSVLKDSGWYGSVAVTFTNTVTGARQFYWGTMQKSTGKVIISEVAIVLNPKAPNGGYCGTFVRGKK